MSAVNLDLSKYGITDVKEIVYNPSYEKLFEEETKPGLKGFEKGVVTQFGAVNVMTGEFTGRSPKDKYIVMDDVSRETIWWTSPKAPNDNKPTTPEVWADLKALTTKQLSGKRLFVVDAFCGTNADTRLKVRFIMEVAWQAHFVKNMFLRPTDEELKNFGEPDFIVMNGSKTTNQKWKEHGLNSEVYTVFNLTEKMQVIGGTWYGGEMKKGMFAMMNYYLPRRGMASMHCSANVGEEGDTSIFFGLSGTGKTTLSTDPSRKLIGDDEHGWTPENSVFNFEGGCYAKVINLSAENEPEIYRAIKKGAILENVILDKEGHVDYEDISITQNTRVSYPIHHIDNIQVPSIGKNPKNIFFLTADAFGVLHPISKLTPSQAAYHFISGYTAKVAGTEAGVVEPQPSFSACFGAPFMPLHPTKYAEMLSRKMKESGVDVWLVNTGWSGGPYGVGSRIKLKYTRAMISAALEGELDKVEYHVHPIFG